MSHLSRKEVDMNLTRKFKGFLVALRNVTSNEKNESHPLSDDMFVSFKDMIYCSPYHGKINMRNDFYNFTSDFKKVSKEAKKKTKHGEKGTPE